MSPQRAKGEFQTLRSPDEVAQRDQLHRGRAEALRRPALRCRGGFVLLLVLLLLALASVAMSGIASRSLRCAMNSNQAAEDLKHRWAVSSLQAAVLERAENMLAEEEKRTGRPAAATQFELNLSGQRYIVLLADEQAKASVNAMYRRLGLRDAETAVRALAGLSNTPLFVRLIASPLNVDRPDGEKSPPFGSFDLVFENASGQMLRMLADPNRVGALLTCWGDGKINAARATREAMRQACVGVVNLSDIEKLIQMRKPGEPLPIDDAIQRLQLPKEKAEAAKRLLTSGSNCHSVWITERNGDRISFDFAVRDDTVKGERQIMRLGWQ